MTQRFHFYVYLLNRNENICPQMPIAALLTIRQKVETTQSSISCQMDIQMW